MSVFVLVDPFLSPLLLSSTEKQSALGLCQGICQQNEKETSIAFIWLQETLKTSSNYLLLRSTDTPPPTALHPASFSEMNQSRNAAYCLSF